MSGTLFIVATPIGNLEDLTPRARQTLGEVSLIAAEDTRHTGRLLMSIGVKSRLIALHDHNEEKVLGKLIRTLQQGESVALVCDAGTPLVSDPGFRLVREAHQNHIRVSPIPGASAATAALSAAGIPTDRFCFEGFLPAKQAARRARLAELASEQRTMIFYESVHRIAECLDDLVDAFGDSRPAFVGRELSKIHEQCVRESLGELKRRIDDGSIVGKGEFVLVVGGASEAAGSGHDADRLLSELLPHMPAKEAAKVASRLTGLKKNALYERLLELKSPQN
ncbi:MAG TPA: 16S rRNA (cytidine(1402)-2'-O)-methyltransferase [Woeseiaceae bacterium]|nr:16S rRNA (cytidine(1402)-2'-O)-methyltransferase [Woeseiaceae bacterium]